jgi:hypothetical protein
MELKSQKMKVVIKQGEPLLCKKGCHILDENGVAKLCEEIYKEITITDPEVIQRLKKVLPKERWDEEYQKTIDTQNNLQESVGRYKFIHPEPTEVQLLKKEIEQIQFLKQEAEKKIKEEQEGRSAAIEKEREIIKTIEEEYRVRNQEMLKYQEEESERRQAESDARCEKLYNDYLGMVNKVVEEKDKEIEMLKQQLSALKK